MGTTTKQIAAHIEETRDALGSNLEELEQKIKAATDWRNRVRTKPKTLLGLAFGGGIVLATVFGGRSNPGERSRCSTFSAGATPLTQAAHHEEVARHAWDKVKATVIAAVTVRLISYAAELLRRSHGKSEHNQVPSDAFLPTGW